MPLAMRIRQDGLPVYGFGTAKTPEGFREACTRFIDVGALAEAAKAEAAPCGAGGRSTTSSSSCSATRSRPQSATSAASPALSEVGKLAGNRSSFDARNYGYAGLSELIQAIPNFQTERREGGRVYVKRVR